MEEESEFCWFLSVACEGSGAGGGQVEEVAALAAIAMMEVNRAAEGLVGGTGGKSLLYFDFQFCSFHAISFVFCFFRLRGRRRLSGGGS